MSIWAVNWAVHTTIPNSTHKLVLIMLANFADDEDLAWPAVDTLAELASVTPRTVQRALEALELDGLLERWMGLAEGRRGGLRRTNSVYRLMVPSTVSRRSKPGTGRPRLVRMDQAQEGEMGQRGTTPADADTAASTMAASSETPSRLRCDTGVTTVTPDGETPSGVRCDTGVTTVDRYDTGDATVTTLVTNPPTPPYKEEPSVRTTNLTPLPPTAADSFGHGQDGQAGRAGRAEASGSAADAATVDETLDRPVEAEVVSDATADWALMRDCLPDEMQALDGPTVARVAALLRERVEAGWSAGLIRATLAANELPKQVHRLGGLVVTRLREIPIEGAPRPRPSALRPVAPVEGPKWHMAFRVEKRRAQLAGLPEGDNSTLWWANHHPGVSQIPIDQDIDEVLRAELETARDDAPSPAAVVGGTRNGRSTTSEGDF